MLIKVDFVYESLLRDIVKWFDANYIWHDKNIRMGIHLDVFMQEYNAHRFSNHKTLGKERERFLEEIQSKAEDLRAMIG